MKEVQYILMRIPRRRRVIPLRSDECSPATEEEEEEDEEASQVEQDNGAGETAMVQSRRILAPFSHSHSLFRRKGAGHRRLRQRRSLRRQGCLCQQSRQIFPVRPHPYVV